jgi:hypothetical protein
LSSLALARQVVEALMVALLAGALMLTVGAASVLVLLLIVTWRELVAVRPLLSYAVARSVYLPLEKSLESRVQRQGEPVSVLSVVVRPLELMSVKTTRRMSEPETSQALVLLQSTFLNVAPDEGALKLTDTACAASGVPASTVIAASAIGVLLNFIGAASLVCGQWTTWPAYQHEPCHWIHYKGNQQLNDKT